MNKKDWEEIIKLNWIKSLDKELISEIKESTSIKDLKQELFFLIRKIFSQKYFLF